MLTMPSTVASSPMMAARPSCWKAACRRRCSSSRNRQCQYEVVRLRCHPLGSAHITRTRDRGRYRHDVEQDSASEKRGHHQMLHQPQRGSIVRRIEAHMGVVLENGSIGASEVQPTAIGRQFAIFGHGAAAVSSKLAHATQPSRDRLSRSLALPCRRITANSRASRRSRNAPPPQGGRRSRLYGATLRRRTPDCTTAAIMKSTIDAGSGMEELAPAPSIVLPKVVRQTL